MQIGCCWFDDERQELINQSNATTWQLNKNEYWVLSLLAKHRGQVVPVELLSFPNDESYQQRISDVDLEEIVKNLRDYLGRSHRSLIELIPSQGIILYNKTIASRNSLFDSPNKAISYAQYILIILMTLIASFFVYSNLNGPDYITPDASRQFTTQDGNVANLYLYRSLSSDLNMDSLANEMADYLKVCKVMPWDAISATMSKDNYAISIVMKKRLATEWRFHNIKVTRDQLQYDFVTPEWLEKVNICG
ncbi:helix-turn-helix domain-containing protein [Shewanella donghaensis]|uniref:helix-turn-helix domain-containing protein n=1 Tax=Shewanella donghaensis TaxID=238836 RepID=UPI001181F37D|nr:helix-turn-helix domain-containing protein [Shewanella donghaensis]